MGRPKGARNKPKGKPAPLNRAEYICCTCGKSYIDQARNFPSSRSPIFAGNNGRIPSCYACMNKFFEEYYNEFGSEKKAMRKLCSKYDIYWSERCFTYASADDSDKDIVRRYVQSTVLKPNTHKTFTDTLEEEDAERRATDEAIADSVKRGASLPPDVYERWGVGYSVEELNYAEDKYNSLVEQSGGEIDETEKTLIRDLVNADILKGRAMKKGDVDEYSKCSKMYRDILKETEFKNRKDTTRSKEIESWGTWVRDIENFCPADLYKRPSLFEDIDGIGEYFQRFIVRPVVNFFTGSRDMDEEYSIGQGD